MFFVVTALRFLNRRRLFTMSEAMLIIFLAHAFGCFSSALAKTPGLVVQHEPSDGHGFTRMIDPCLAFRRDNTMTTGSGWLLDDCIDVWRSWTASLPLKTVSKKENRQALFQVTRRLQEQGTPCYVRAKEYPDGAGSRFMRSVAAWIYAEEVGCNLLVPEGYQPGGDGMLYCHGSRYINEKKYRCASMDWIEYFQSTRHMTSVPDDGQVRQTVQVSVQQAPADLSDACIRRSPRHWR